MESRRLSIIRSHLLPTSHIASPSSQFTPSNCSSSDFMTSAGDDKTTQHCVFCSIVRGDSPALKLYEDDLCLCILDRNPLSHGHSLIIPKTHFSCLESTPPSIRIVKKKDITSLFDYQTVSGGNDFLHFSGDTVAVTYMLIAAMCSKAPFIANALMKASGSDSFNLLVNNGAAAGQVIYHTHIHIIPRKTNDCLWTTESLPRYPLIFDQEASHLVSSVREQLMNVFDNYKGGQESGLPRCAL